jgi:hypothetical protein
MKMGVQTTSFLNTGTMALDIFSEVGFLDHMVISLLACRGNSLLFSEVA